MFRKSGSSCRLVQAFLDDLRSTLPNLFTRHGGAEGEVFRLAVACYLKEETDE